MSVKNNTTQKIKHRFKVFFMKCEEIHLKKNIKKLHFLYISSRLKKIRSSHQRCPMKKVVLRIFAKFTGKHLYQSLGPATLLKKRLWHRCFPVNFAKFLRTPFLQTTSGRLLLEDWDLKSYLTDGNESNFLY